jgi:CheY-like chemotaxis protein
MGATSPSGGKARVLVVEDDEETRGLVRAALEEQGYVELPSWTEAPSSGA